MNSRDTKIVLYIAHSANLYGGELCLFNLVSKLDRSRFQPVVVLPKNGPLKQKLEDAHVTVEVIPSITAWLTKRQGIQRLLHFLAVVPLILFSVWRLHQIIARYQADLIHTNSLVIIDGALAARLTGLPHVWHARELLVPQTVFNFLFGPSVALSIINYLSDQIIAISAGIRQVFCQQVDCSKVRVVYDGIPIEEFQKTGSGVSIRSQFGFSRDTFLVGEIGMVTGIKGYEELVKAASIVRQTISNVKFIGIGGNLKSDLTYQHKLLELINNLNLQDVFILTGYRHDVAEILSELDLLVLPSHSEGFGLVLVEAMAAGKPVIGTKVGGIPEIIEDGITGFLIPPHSPDKLAQAIIKILENPDLAHNMGSRGRQKAEIQFNLQQSINEIQKIYEQILDKS